jgi:hypothetical protein
MRAQHLMDVIFSRKGVTNGANQIENAERGDRTL